MYILSLSELIYYQKERGCCLGDREQAVTITHDTGSRWDFQESDRYRQLPALQNTFQSLI